MLNQHRILYIIERSLVLLIYKIGYLKINVSFFSYLLLEYPMGVLTKVFSYIIYLKFSKKVGLKRSHHTKKIIMI